MRKYFYFYRRIIKFALRYRWIYILNFIFTFLWLATLNFSIFQLKDIVNTIGNGGDLLNQVLRLAAIITLPILFQPVAFYLKASVYSKVTRDLMNEVYANVMRLDYAFHTNRSTGALITKILQSESVVATFLFSLELFILLNVASLIFPIIFIGLITPYIAAALLSTTLLLSPIILWAIKFNMRIRVQLRDTEYDRNSAIVDGITNYETIRIFGRKEEDEGYVYKLMEKVNNAMMKYQNSFRYMDVGSRLIGAILFLVSGFLVIGAYDSGAINIGELVVILTYSITIANQVIEVALSSREIFKNVPLMEDVFELLDARPKVDEPEKPKKIRAPKGLIELKDVFFRYEKQKHVINGISMRIDPGQTVAFVGPSGGGKSTLVRLILRYFDAQKGKVAIDNIDVRDLGTENVGKLIAVVPQEPVLFNRSILYNIGFAFSSEEEEIEKRKGDIIEAAKRAQIHSFITSLPNGYNTVVGERGIKLSGGQKQRIAIARAILKDPKIIIFDEATSMLDSESEQAIQKAFRELVKDTTTIIIAHRLSTIKDSDKIYVIDSGKIVEEGKHDELLESGELYAKLWSIQSGGFKKSK